MSHFKVNERDIYFILKEQLHYGDLCKLARYGDMDVETLDMLVSEAVKFAGGIVAPLQELGDKHGVTLNDGKVCCAPGFREAFGLFGENGWLAATSDSLYDQNQDQARSIAPILGKIRTSCGRNDDNASRH